MLKSLLFLALCFSKIALASDTDVFMNLPFGMIPGQTKNSEIENRGGCQKKIQVSDSYFRCEMYLINAGSYTVESSQNEIITKIVFGSSSRLPNAWKSLGLKFYQHANGFKEQGTRTQDFINIVNNGNVENKELRKKYDSTAYANVVSFDTNGLHYEFYFEFFLQDVEWGLSRIEVTESY